MHFEESYSIKICVMMCDHYETRVMGLEDKEDCKHKVLFTVHYIKQ